MNRFNKALHGYDPIEVNQFIDNIIIQVEKIINASKMKDKRIKDLEEELSDYRLLKEKLDRYVSMEDTLRKAILMTQKTSEQMKLNVIKESELILDDAKRNASRIVNDALIKADAKERELENLKRNILLFKRKLKDQLQVQLDMVDEIEEIDI